MSFTTEIFKLNWQGIEITIEYKANSFNAYKEVYGVALTHIQVKSPRSLPITESGYYSNYVRADYIEEWGGPVEYIKAWLDSAANTPEWKQSVEQSRQLTLF